MKIYISGSSMEIDRARLWTTRLIEAGHEVVSTWPTVIQEQSNGVGNPRDATRLQRAEWSINDVDEVLSADMIWLLTPGIKAVTRGAWFEVGIAFANQILFVASGDTKQSIFCALGDEYETDEAAFKAIITGTMQPAAFVPSDIVQ